MPARASRSQAESWPGPWGCRDAFYLLLRGQGIFARLRGHASRGGRTEGSQGGPKGLGPDRGPRPTRRKL
eukprot:5986558-Alexandrium_andersonii.AAC.1